MESVEHASEEIKSGNHHKISQAAGRHTGLSVDGLLLLFLFVVDNVVQMLQLDIRELIDKLLYFCCGVKTCFENFYLAIQSEKSKT